MSSTNLQPTRSKQRTAALAVVAAVLLTLGLISPAAAAPPNNPKQSAAGWLAAQVNADGALEGFTPGVANYGTTLDGIIGLSAAGAEGPTAERMLAFVNANIAAAVAPGGNDSPGRLAQAILANVALGEDPADVGGIDLVARLQATERTVSPNVGLFGNASPTFDGAYRQGLALLALASVNVDAPAAEAWLVDQQCGTGSWVAYRADTAVPCPAVDVANWSGPDTNSTALALLGLTAQGVTPDADAQAWLESVRTPSGAFPYFGDPASAPDASSTGLSLAALRTVTGATDTEGQAGLRTFQIPCGAEDPADIGGLFYQAAGGEELPDNLSTAQGLWGLGDVAFPVIDATLADHVDTDCIASCSSPTPHSFTDVPANSSANTAISWLVESNITQGVTPTEFRPNGKVTRGQMAAFLWRAFGSPAPAQAHSFADVPADAYYNTAVSWLVGENITAGTGNGRFSPNNQVTRGQTASLLHRAAGSPAAATHHAFTDVAPTAYYDGAVSWLVEAGITSGVSEDRFAPNNVVTRAQMAVFLYRSACGADS